MLKSVVLALTACAFFLFPPLSAQNTDAVPDTTSAADSVITFNEIMYHPTKDDTSGEWLELYNQMSINMDISNWRITGGIDFRFPTNTTFPANSYLIVAADPQTFKSVNRTANVFGPFTNSLSNGGETLRLRNNSGRLMDEVGYDDKEPWPIGADGSNVGRTLVAVDAVGSGVGETVFFVRGKEASFPFYPTEVPADAGIVGIVDHYDIDELTN